MAPSRKNPTPASIRDHARRCRLPCKRIHGYDVYFRELEDGTEWNAFAPSLPGCVGGGASRSGCERNMASMIEEHVALLEEAGEPVPPRDGRGKPRPAGRKGRHVNIPSRITDEAGHALEDLTRSLDIRKTDVVEEAILLAAELLGLFREEGVGAMRIRLCKEDRDKIRRRFRVHNSH